MLHSYHVVKITRMMSATIRRKALSLCSSALANNGIVQSLERAQPALAGAASRLYAAGIPTFEPCGRGSKLVSEFHEDLSTQKWIRSFSSYSGAVRGDIGEPIAQIQEDKSNFAEIKKKINTVNRTHNGSAFFTASGAVVGSVLSTPIVNAPQAAKLGVGSTVSSTFLPNLALFWHINNGIEEIVADYVHHEMTRSLVLVMMRLFLIVAAKDVFMATN